MNFDEFVPKYIKQVLNYRTKQSVTADRWNELWNLIITQGDYNTDEIGALVAAMTLANTNISERTLFKSADTKYIRFSDGVIQVSSDNVTWTPGYTHPTTHSADMLTDGINIKVLTNELKAAYDAAVLAKHTHQNSNALNAVSGTNTGDQDLSGYVLKSDATRVPEVVQDTGDANNIVVTLTNPPASYYSGFRVIVKVHYSNTSTSVSLNANGLGNSPVKNSFNQFLKIGELSTSGYYEFMWNGAFACFQLIGSAMNANLLQGYSQSSSATGDTIARRDTSGAMSVAAPTDNAHAVNKNFLDTALAGYPLKSDYTKVPQCVNDTGTENNIIISPNPAITSYDDTIRFFIKVKYASTGNVSITASSLAAKPLYDDMGQRVGWGGLQSNGIYYVAYNSTLGGFQLLTASANAYMLNKMFPSTTYTASSIMQRDSSGRSEVNDPASDYHIVNKRFGAATYEQKLATASPSAADITAAVNTIYYLDWSSNQTIVLPTTCAVGDRIVFNSVSNSSYIDIQPGAGTTIMSIGLSGDITNPSSLRFGGNSFLEFTCVKSNSQWQVTRMNTEILYRHVGSDLYKYDLPDAVNNKFYVYQESGTVYLPPYMGGFVNTIILTGSSLQTIPLSLTPGAIGHSIKIIGYGTGCWKLTQAAGVTVKYNGMATTSGKLGYIQSLTANTSIELMIVDTDYSTYVVYEIVSLEGKISLNGTKTVSSVPLVLCDDSANFDSFTSAGMYNVYNSGTLYGLIVLALSKNSAYLSQIRISESSRIMEVRYSADSGATWSQWAGTIIDASNQTIGGVKTFTSLRLGGELDQNSYTIVGVEYDNGNSGTTKTIDFTKGNHQKITMSDNCTFTFSAPSNACMLSLRLIQDGTGNRSIILPAIKWPSGVSPTWSAAANAIDILSLFYDGTNYYGQYSLAFA